MTANERCIRFIIGTDSWFLDLDVLTLNDQIALQQLSGMSWGKLLAAFFDERDSLALKVLLWAARRAAREDITFDDPAMNPRASEVLFSTHAKPPAPEPEAEPMSEPEPSAHAWSPPVEDPAV